MREQLPPYSDDAEEATLGSILIDDDAMVTVSTIVNSEDFFSEQNQFVYGAMLRIYNRGEGINQITVAEELVALEKLDEAGGASYMSHLVAMTPTSIHAQHYAKIVRDMAYRRRLISAAGQIENLAYKETDINICREKTERMLLGIQSNLVMPNILTPQNLAELGGKHYESLRNPNHRVAISTGYDDLDYHTGGLFPGDYIILAARAGLGKSQVALQFAEYMGQIAPVLICPIEMDYQQLLDRLVSSHSGVPIRQIRSGGYSDELTERIFAHALPSIHESGIYMLSLNNDFIDYPTVTINLIGSMARHMKMAYGLGVIIIDYIGLLDPISGDEKRSRADQIRHISRRIKVLTNNLGVATIAVTQINREPERRADKRPTMADIAESGGLEQDADGIWLLYRDDYYDPESSAKGEAEFIVAKQRQGQSNVKFTLHWNEVHSRYQEIGRMPQLSHRPFETPEAFK